MLLFESVPLAQTVHVGDYGSSCSCCRLNKLPPCAIATENAQKRVVFVPVVVWNVVGAAVVEETMQTGSS